MVWKIPSLLEVWLKTQKPAQDLYLSHVCEYSRFEYEYKYKYWAIKCEYIASKYKYKFLKIVLEYYSSINSKYYNSVYYHDTTTRISADYLRPNQIIFDQLWFQRVAGKGKEGGPGSIPSLPFTFPPTSWQQEYGI